MEESDTKVLMGALLVAAGAILGAGVALLLAPQSGKETRRDIARYSRKAGRRIGGIAGEVAEAVTDMAEAVEEKAEELLGQGKDLTKETRDAVLSVFEEGQKRLSRQQDRLAKLLG